MKRRDVLVTMCVGLVMTLGWSSCKTTSAIPEPGTMPAGVSLAGVWYSSQFDQMYIRQVGSELRGIYTYKYGGTIEGEPTGDIVKFKWIDPGDSESARRTFRGEGYWRVVKEGDRIFLRGKWWYEDNPDQGGPWEAERIRDIESSDPKSLDEFRERNVR